MKRCLVEWALASLLSQSAILEDKKMFLVSQMIMFYTLKNLADSFIHSSFYWLSRCHLLDDTTVDTTCHLLLTWLQVHVGKKWKYNKTRIQEGRGAVSFVSMSTKEHQIESYLYCDWSLPPTSGHLSFWTKIRMMQMNWMKFTLGGVKK